jgi:hypothetical protein
LREGIGVTDDSGADQLNAWPLSPEELVDALLKAVGLPSAIIIAVAMLFKLSAWPSAIRSVVRGSRAAYRGMAVLGSTAMPVLRLRVPLTFLMLSAQASALSLGLLSSRLVIALVRYLMGDSIEGNFLWPAMGEGYSRLASVEYILSLAVPTDETVALFQVISIASLIYSYTSTCYDKKRYWLAAAGMAGPAGIFTLLLTPILFLYVAMLLLVAVVSVISFMASGFWPDFHEFAGLPQAMLFMIFVILTGWACRWASNGSRVVREMWASDHD